MLLIIQIVLQDCSFRWLLPLTIYHSKVSQVDLCIILILLDIYVRIFGIQLLSDTVIVCKRVDIKVVLVFKEVPLDETVKILLFDIVVAVVDLEENVSRLQIEEHFHCDIVGMP